MPRLPRGVAPKRHKVGAWVTEEEFTRISAEAEARQMSIAEYIRSLLIKKRR